MKLNPLVIALGLIPLVGCGSSSTEPAPAVATTYSVRAVDGYLNNALVWLDLNGDCQLDKTIEPYARSNKDGIAELDVTNTADPENYSVVVSAIAGETIDSDSINDTHPDGVAITTPFLMSAPAGQTVVTPLSTLVSIKMHNDIELTLDSATEAVASELEINKDILLDDYIATEQGDVASKANAIVELAVLPASENELEAMMVDSSALDAELQPNLDVVQTLTNDVRLINDDGEVLVTPNIDSDSDGVLDALDAFPNDASETLDSDLDGTGDNSDAFPDDASETLDTDSDGMGDNADVFPNDATETLDSDEDGVGDNSDAFPNNASETLDTDNDGMGDNADVFPNDATETLDSDLDGTGDNSDAFPTDASESLDTDGDSVGDNADVFPNDATETRDSDLDGTGDNSDAFPNDATETVDSDADGIGDNSDAYPEDVAKSIADSTTTLTYTTPFISGSFTDIAIVELVKSTTIKTFNNGEIHTDTLQTYTYESGNQYSQQFSQDILLADGRFTRINSSKYDVNDDGQSLYFSNSLDIGERTSGGETYWSYIDEGDAATEGGDNGGADRVFDDVNFSDRTHPEDLSNIDVIIKIYNNWSDAENVTTINTHVDEYPKDDFNPETTDISTFWYSEDDINVFKDGKISEISIQKDWFADGSINQSYALKITETDQYSYVTGMPIWANPHDGIVQEYADYSNIVGKADTLTSHWYEMQTTVNGDIEIVAGQRYVLNTDEESADQASKLTTVENPEGLLFEEYLSTTTVVDDQEMTEFATWQHYSLADYDFTTENDDPGQVYKIYQRQDNGIWVGFSFAEWGSQEIEDLAGDVETARNDGTALSEINIDGLSASNKPTTTESFVYDDDGVARKWYLVSDNASISSDGDYAVKEVTLTDNGIVDGWLVFSAADNFFLAAPKYFHEDESPNVWDWFDAYYHYGLYIDAIDTSMDNFMWSSWWGEFYLDQAQAQARVTELQASMTDPSTAIIGSWLYSEGDGKRNILTIIDEDSYIIIHEHDDGDQQTAGSAEYGNYTWDQSSGDFTTSLIDESDGSGGLYDEGSSVTTASLDGDSLTFNDAFTFERIISDDNPLIGGWIKSDNVLVFLSDSEYNIAHWDNEEKYTDQETTQALSGEFGTYQLEEDGTFTVTNVTVDSDGEGGLYNAEDATDQENETLVLTDSSLVFSDQYEGEYNLQRIEAK